jgi:hypothetical protein
MIGNYHKWHAGQLWNTIDERSNGPKEFAEEMGEPGPSAVPDITTFQCAA